MKKDNVVKLLAVALVVAIISTGLFYGLFVNKLNSATNQRTLVIAGKALKPGTVLVAADLKTVPWAAEQFPQGAYQNPQEVVGSTVFDPIGDQEPVLRDRLTVPAGKESSSGATTGTTTGALASIPKGMRAVSVHVTDSAGILALLRSGQRVDVQVVVGRGTSGETEVRTALENLAVLSVIPQPEQSSQGQNLPVVTLLAKPADADALAVADSGARIRLALRNPQDNDARLRAPLALGSVMRGN